VSTAWKPPEFSKEAWYSDPGDHRCPHDAWLESVEVREPAKGDRSQHRRTAITLKLLGAYQDGWIILTYSGVRSHTLTLYQCDQGVGDWLRDEFSPSSAGLICHRITWCSGAAGTSQWLIEAEDVKYEWQPKRSEAAVDR
jgi:hypothetical protein